MMPQMCCAFSISFVLFFVFGLPLFLLPSAALASCWGGGGERCLFGTNDQTIKCDPRLRLLRALKRRGWQLGQTPWQFSKLSGFRTSSSRRFRRKKKKINSFFRSWNHRFFFLFSPNVQLIPAQYSRALALGFFASQTEHSCSRYHCRFTNGRWALMSNY